MKETAHSLVFDLPSSISRVVIRYLNSDYYNVATTVVSFGPLHPNSSLGYESGAHQVRLIVQAEFGVDLRCASLFPNRADFLVHMSVSSGMVLRETHVVLAI